ncbi:unnamed protein product [Brassica oleracea]
MPFETSSKHLFHWDIKPMKWARRVRADCGNKIAEGSSGRVDQCGIPERPLDCEPLYRG